MAYLKQLSIKCDACDKRATDEVFNARNASIGKFCPACANQKLRELIANEEGRRTV